MSSIYYQEIQHVVNQSLQEMREQQNRGRVPKNALSETHFLVHWVTKALKTHQFDRCVVADLVKWQKLGRTKGTLSDLLNTFIRISELYAQVTPIDREREPLTEADFETLIHGLESQDWIVEIDEELSGKVRLESEGENSLVFCSKQLATVFENEQLVAPISCYVRGDHQRFLQMATKAGILMHKQSDYKSIVKYHGEYVIYPKNIASQLAEMPPLTDSK
ncbi:MAG: DUF2913 family protein [Aliivibrio sp.]|uniref:DUF2913 family protein n=1 Tax=Aliivibrio sp. TaxID=1872443 RepID=UPI001A647A59|nr:DUF2913 family protein [Aliivibrio sp.]